MDKLRRKDLEEEVRKEKHPLKYVIGVLIQKAEHKFVVKT